jgi:hypothetical protein
MTTTGHEASDGKPWLDEPLESRWIDEATGLPCWARRYGKESPWRGYVGFATTESVEVDGDCVHGGVTGDHEILVDSLADAALIERAGCDPQHMRWRGFDCYHYGDAIPQLHEFSGTWRSLDFVRAECAKLARALRNALDGP